MNQPRHRATPAVLAIAAVLVALAPSAQARNVRLMESVPDAIRGTRTHDILGTLDLRFGSDSAKGAQIVRRDVVVKGVGSTKVDDVGEDDRVRPRDHELCARAFEDAMTKLAFAARGARGTAIVGGTTSVQGVASPLAEAHGFKPTDAEACANAVRDALERLATAARAAGGHAVVGIVSTYNGNTVDDPAQVECRMGSAKVLAPLSGVIAKGVPPKAP